MQNWYQIAKLLARQRVGQLTEKEQRELKKWQKATLANQALYAQWQKGDFLEIEYKKYKIIDTDYALQVMKERILLHRKKTLKRYILRWESIVAMFAISIFCGLYFIETKPKTMKMPKTTIALIADSRPILTLGNGETLYLDSLKGDFEEAGIIIKKAEHLGLSYTPKNKTEETTSLYNIIEIPKGAEFHLTLSDGTQVWLNACSKLKYPVSFFEKTRIVELEGEAYFKVSPDVEKVFRVITHNQSIEVLGTEFNVMAYPEEENTYTTLVHGKVKIDIGDQSLVLQPGIQSIVNHEGIRSRKVNISEIISWRDGMFVLESYTLEEIMAKLARWYDFSVFYQTPSLKEVTFKGKIHRYTSFEAILNILEKTGEVKFDIKNKTVIVYH